MPKVYVSIPAPKAGLVLIEGQEAVSLCWRNADGTLELPEVMVLRNNGGGIDVTRVQIGHSDHFAIDADGRIVTN